MPGTRPSDRTLAGNRNRPEVLLEQLRRLTPIVISAVARQQPMPPHRLQQFLDHLRRDGAAPLHQGVTFRRIRQMQRPPGGDTELQALILPGCAGQVDDVARQIGVQKTLCGAGAQIEHLSRFERRDRFVSALPGVIPEQVQFGVQVRVADAGRNEKTVELRLRGRSRWTA